jgi:hypothetical protein
MNPPRSRVCSIVIPYWCGGHLGMIPPTNSEQEGACDGFISQGQAGGVLDQEPAPARGRGGTGLRSRMPVILNNSTDSRFCHKAKRLQALEDEMQVANAAYVQAVDRVSAYPCAIPPRPVPRLMELCRGLAWSGYRGVKRDVGRRGRRDC